MKKVYFVIFLSFISYTHPAEQNATLSTNKSVPSLQKLAALKVWEAIEKPGTKGLENPPTLNPLIVKVLEKYKPSKFQDTTLLCQAAKINHLPLTKALIKAKVDVNSKTLHEKFPLYIAAEEGHLQIAKSLIKAGADVNAETRPILDPLYFKIRSDFLDTNNPIDPNHPKSFRKGTPLSIAFQNCHLEIAADLIEAGADITIKDYSDNTPLHLAAQSGCLQIVTALIAKKAVIDAQNSINNTPLSRAACRGYSQIVETLITAGANANTKDLFGNTPLHLAAKSGHLEVVKTLIAQKVTIDALNIFKDSPLDLAAKKGHLKIIPVLVAAEANISDPKSNPLFIGKDIMDSLGKNSIDN